MSVVTVIRKIGERVISVVEEPLKYIDMLCAFLKSLKSDGPATQEAIAGTVQRIEALGPDVLGALAAKGLDIPDDLKAGADIQGLFAYIQSTLLPAIEKDYADFEALKEKAEPVPAAPAPIASATVDESQVVKPGPGLHTLATA